jgi:Fic family protein
MRSFLDLDRTIGHVPARVVRLLSAVDVGRGSEALYRDQLPGLLDALAECARIASVTTSSAIEGVIVSDAVRAQGIIRGRVRSLRNRSEQEFAGYRDALDYLLREEWQPLNTGLLLHLHRLLFAHTASPGGTFKSQDNLVVDRAPDGATSVRFTPVPSRETDFYVNELVAHYRAAIRKEEHHPILLIGLFVLDLLVIHPFEDGNGRVARALTNALLADAGYGAIRYISLEQAIAQSVDTYYQALLDSTHGWHQGDADPWPWLGYLVEILADAYRTFAQRASAERSDGTKQERVRDYVLRHAPTRFRVSDVRMALPGISDPTIRVVLGQLRQEGVITAEGTGRSAAWHRQDDGNHEVTRRTT